ncbi:MAG: hypothetical protein QNK04_21935 [Myxococcota bacterium]|nr:hypothetical protein [Myxococcota bacterium]
MLLGELRQLALHLSRSGDIARRYFVVNGFDGALTMLGLLMGFRLAGGVDLDGVLAVCHGAAIALGVSGVTSAYLSETAERRRELSELEEAMITDMSDTAHGRAARVLPLLVAGANGAAPVVLAGVIVAPLWLARAGLTLPVRPLTASIATAFLCIFGLGAFIGRVGGTSWLRSGVKTTLVALVTVGLILLFDSAG